MKGEILFLGTGASAGIPMIGCSCLVCNSEDPHNKRLRPSALVSVKEKKLLIDAGPDIRYQALKYGISHIDSVLLTHTHYDHIGGLDELRAFYLINHAPLPLLASQFTLNDLKVRYPYLFKEKSWSKSLSAQFHFHILEKKRGVIDFGGINIGYMTYTQGDMEVNGFRFGNLAYVSDIRKYPLSLFEDLHGVKFLVVGALRETTSAMHFSIEEAVDFGKKTGAEKVFLTHISHEMEHENINRLLPEGFALAFDGLKVEFDYE